MSNRSQEDELTYGIDYPSPDGDHMALSIKIGKKVYSFVGAEAEAIQAYLDKKVLEARIDGINEAHEKILEIVFTYTGGDGLENFCDVDDISRVAMSWKVDRIAELKAKQTKEER